MFAVVAAVVGVLREIMQIRLAMPEGDDDLHISFLFINFMSHWLTSNDCLGIAESW